MSDPACIPAGLSPARPPVPRDRRPLSRSADLLPAAEAIVATLDLIERKAHCVPAREVIALLDADRARLRAAIVDAGGEA